MKEIKRIVMNQLGDKQGKMIVVNKGGGKLEYVGSIYTKNIIEVVLFEDNIHLLKVNDTTHIYFKKMYFENNQIIRVYV